MKYIRYKQIGYVKFIYTAQLNYVKHKYTLQILIKIENDLE